MAIQSQTANCDSANHTQTQMEPEVFQIHMGIANRTLRIAYANVHAKFKPLTKEIR